jgi:hypothetical protein
LEAEAPEILTVARLAALRVATLAESDVEVEIVELVEID